MVKMKSDKICFENVEQEKCHIISSPCVIKSWGFLNNYVNMSLQVWECVV